MTNSAVKPITPSGVSTCYALIHKRDTPCIDKHACPLEMVKKTKQSVVVEHIHNDKDGNSRNYEVHGYPIFDNDGNIIQMIEYTLDITNRKKAEKELNNTLKDLRRSNAELEQFAYVTSHDLQEPLRMVASFTQLLQNRYHDKLDDDANDFINYAVEGASRMHNLISDLLIFSRVGTRGKSFKTTDMNTVLDAVIATFQQVIKETNTTITYKPLPVIIADESQMIQLLQNLISNAIKFRSEESPRINVSGDLKADKWIFSVSDNGIGIDSKNFDRIFIIFQRLHKKEEYSGTGIGLAVCKKIIQRHRGKIWVESELGKGSTFYFSIPKLEVAKNES
jgi:light-regulated signal transduction histidine kinase (bacteriophytochrome)